MEENKFSKKNCDCQSTRKYLTIAAVFSVATAFHGNNTQKISFEWSLTWVLSTDLKQQQQQLQSKLETQVAEGKEKIALVLSCWVTNASRIPGSINY